MEFPAWILEEDFLVGLGAFSLLTFVGSLVLVPVLIARMPDDYFCSDVRHVFIQRLPPLLRALVLVVKNVAGVLLLLAGILMLVLPGQGLLTMVIGIALLDIPGKLTLEKKLVQRPAIHKALNWVRKRAGKAAFCIPNDL